MLPFGEYRPDIANYNGATSLLVQNVVPRADGYGPWKSFVPYSNAMPGATANRGFFYARKSDGSVAAFAGTVNKLYRLNATGRTSLAAAIPIYQPAITGSSPSSAISSLPFSRTPRPWSMTLRRR